MMRDENEFVNIACETLCILKHCDKSFINKIPAKILNKLKSIENNSSTPNIIIYKNKKIEEQEISEDTKNFIALLYYNYVANVEERKYILNIWTKNDNINNVKKDTINLFKTKKNLIEPKKFENIVSDNTDIIVYKENIFKKLLIKIKHLFINKK